MQCHVGPNSLSISFLTNAAISCSQQSFAIAFLATPTVSISITASISVILTSNSGSPPHTATRSPRSVSLSPSARADDPAPASG
eukprot:CAMPEP_0184731322 /NCGR_PEP_ID=MMETSP0314-20130426/50567_1 /TAXON_ID=38298 /ORGANISM="Rhodella maculata, Strain CCMP 736" /LENGTH=83 /DNA_ID=CAMNT_0027197681 /DNA_START=65 /DNA_END=312 /DNA_ORIENTATION=+